MGILIRGTIGSRKRCVLDIDIIAPYGVFPQGHRELRGIIDTGSEGTLIQEGLAHALSLPIEGVKLVTPVVGKVVACATTAADIVFRGEDRSGRQATRTVTMKLIAVNGQFDDGFDIILGMDALEQAYGELLISFPATRWSFEIP